VTENEALGVLITLFEPTGPVGARQGVPTATAGGCARPCSVHRPPPSAESGLAGRWPTARS
jgi:hypothetical protein